LKEKIKNYTMSFLVFFVLSINFIGLLKWFYENNLLYKIIWILVGINFMISLGFMEIKKSYTIISFIVLLLLIGLMFYNESKWHYTGINCDGTSARTWDMNCMEYANYVCKDVCNPREYSFKLPCNIINCYCKDGWLDWVEGSIC
jgi:hypothetical protein